MEEYIVIFIIFILATLLGFFINKAMEAEKLRDLRNQVKDNQHLKDKLALSERSLIAVNQEKSRLMEAEEKIREDFYRLTLTYKNLQDDFHRRQELLRQQYEVPPELPLLKESNKLLAHEIEKLRKKLHKWKTKDFVFENKSLQKKLKQSNKKLLKLEAEIESQQDLEKYEALYKKIQALGKEAKVLINEKKQKPNKQKKLSTIEESIDPEEELNFFRMQPKSKKDKIFKDIINQKDTKVEPKGAFDIDDDTVSKKSLMDLVDINDKVYAVLINAGIETFEDLTETKIADLRLLLEIGGLKPKKYQYSTWPIQARLAQRGEWGLINEYKKA